MTLVEFIRARLAEDEQWAREASRRHFEGQSAPDGVHWQWECGNNDQVLEVNPMLGEFLECSEGCASAQLRSIEVWPSSVGSLPQMPMSGAEEVDASVAGHIVRHDPARVLAEIAAKERILEECTYTLDNEEHGYVLAGQVLQLLAMPYVAHPDYQKVWRATHLTAL